MWSQKEKLALFLSLPLLAFDISAAQEGRSTVTIFSVPALTNIRPCATSCMGRVAYYIECPSSPLINSCFCRTDLTDIARTSIYNCVDSYCNGGVSMDGVGMTSIYTSYCNAVNANQAVDVGAGTDSTPPNTAQTTSNGGPGVQTSVRTTVETITTKVESVVTVFTGTITTQVESAVTKVILSTFTTVLSDETLQQFADEYKNGKSGGLEKGYQVAIAVGVVAIAIIVLLLFMNKIRRRWFGYQGPQPEVPMPQPPMGGIEGPGEQQNIGQPKYYN
ncbi:hypothetical protein H072_2262 [Dactylellina haptotyla CBS 200.50]|uniref:Extracellular membrane protein CFEM domain-containing protein n=1 Tax=Dactylellina haptotyla (strain CBS 200.50) TaxID=1284197 RepID=S8ALB8_DACHA|nr:hypothetical protein H072_2262 [Dactylellina haptotyla CBS 200.50]